MNERRRFFAALVLLIAGCSAVVALSAILLSVSLPQIQSTLFIPTPTLTVLTRGEQLYIANCQVCHLGREGGQMMDYPPRHNANGHTWHHPDCELTTIILNGGDEMTEMMRQMMNPNPDTPRMPAWKDKLSREDIDVILTFIKTWWTADEREFQARTTQEQCRGS